MCSRCTCEECHSTSSSLPLPLPPLCSSPTCLHFHHCQHHSRPIATPNSSSILARAVRVPQIKTHGVRALVLRLATRRKAMGTCVSYANRAISRYTVCPPGGLSSSPHDRRDSVGQTAAEREDRYKDRQREDRYRGQTERRQIQGQREDREEMCTAQFDAGSRLCHIR